MAYLHEKIETMPREELKKLQSERLVAQVKRCYERVECFRNRMNELGLTPDDIHGIQDISKLPFSYKNDLRDYYPYGLFAEPMEKVVRVHASSGTTGKRIVVGYTENDLQMWSECMARMLTAIGVGKDDIAQVSFGYGLFTGGFGAHGGAEMVGATVIPMSSGNTALQIQTMIDFGATVLFCTPSYAMYLAEEVERLGVKDQLKLRVGVFGAEPWSEDLRQKIEEQQHRKRSLCDEGRFLHTQQRQRRHRFQEVSEQRRPRTDHRRLFGRGHRFGGIDRPLRSGGRDGRRLRRTDREGV